jgi:hypothetical protein
MLIELEYYRQLKYAIYQKMAELLYRPDELVFEDGMWMIVCDGDYNESRILGRTMEEALKVL